MHSQSLNLTSSAFQQPNVPSHSIFHPILHSAFSTHPDIILRPFRPSDTQELINLHKQSFPINYGSYFYNRIISKQLHCLVAECSITVDSKCFKAIVHHHEKYQSPKLKVEGVKEVEPYYNISDGQTQQENIEVEVIVGFAVFSKKGSDGYLQESWWSGWLYPLKNSYYIMTLGVIEEFRKKGIGKMLIEAIINQTSIDQQIKLIYLHVIDYNKAAIKLYEKTGFILLQNLSDYYDIDKKSFDGRALGLYVNDGKRRYTWKQTCFKWWNGTE